MELTEQKIIRILFCKIAHYIASFNIYAFGWESDFLSITKSGYAVEYEIKISKSDFKADAKKRGSAKKYNPYAEYGKRQTYYTKAEDLKLGKGANRFYYVCPVELIDIEEIPDYAGLIYVDNRFVKVVKKAPLLHKNKEWNNITNKINVSNYYKLFNRL